MSTKAAGQSSKPAAVAPKAAPIKPGATGAAAAAAAAKMHKRSRSGCFTCRLRRKKCDEGKPCCKACKHLGLKCEYKRPLWWSNNEQRKQNKEAIKNVIKRTKLSEKSAKQQHHSEGADTPPGLTHSLPTSATYSDPSGRTRAASEDSDYSFDFNTAPPFPHGTYDMYNLQVYTPSFDPAHPHQLHHAHYHPAFPPPTGVPGATYEVDVHTERQMYVDDIPTRKDSTHSTFSTFHPPPHGNLAPVPEDDWPGTAGLEDIYDTPGDMFCGAKEPDDDFSFFDFQHPAPAAQQQQQQQQQQATVQVDECDRPLLEHFVDNVLRLIFPILEVHQHGTARSEVIVPALESNKCYLHCCLSIAAIHLKSTLPANADPSQVEQLEADIVRHRYATIAELCEALSRDENHMQILEATLGMIFFQCSVGRPDDSLPDIAWHQHFQAATNLVQKLDLPGLIQTSPSRPPFNMTLTAWIDILGATMLGQAPQFANTYREMHLAGKPLGLVELMGCEDRTMCLISEIACLEALKLSQALDHTNLCSHIALLGQQMEHAEIPQTDLESAVSSSGAVRPKHLARNMTALFLKAARIWLVSLVPGATRCDPAMLNLQRQFVDLLGFVPTGPGGFDRSIVWPLLMAGAQSTPDGPLRQALEDRMATMGSEASETGAFGRVRSVLAECWALQTEAESRGEEPTSESVAWRDVMQARGWDFLLL